MAIMKDQEKASDQEETTTETNLTSATEAENLATDLLEKKDLNAMRIVASKVLMNVVLKEISTKIATTTNTAIAVTLEVLPVTNAASKTKVVVTTDLNVEIMNVVAAVDSKEEKKIRSTTDQRQQDKSASTNTSPTLAFVHAAKLTTLSSPAQ